jgi:hypothetical protein
MTTTVEKTIEVDVPVSTAYDQWTQFESFPEFMGGVKRVDQLDDRRLHWVAEIAGVAREWDARIVEQEPDTKVAWAATEGATNAGAVHFSSLGPTRTLVRLHLEYEPEGLVEKAGDALNIVQKQAEGDLERFKAYIESRGTATGSWRGSVPGAAGVPGVEDAAQTRGDSGKAGVTGKAVAAGVAAAAVGAAVAGAAAKKAADSEADSDDVQRPITDLPPTTGTTSPASTAAPGSAVPAGADPLVADPLTEDDALLAGTDPLAADDERRP